MLAQLLTRGDLSDPYTRAEWTFFHADHHNKMAQQIQSRFGIVVPNGILDPVAERDVGRFFERHQLLHSRVNAILGLAGQDISAASLEDKKSVTDWLEINFYDHLRWQSLLGLPR